MIFTQIKKTASGAAAAKNPNVLVIAVKDILTWPARNSKKVLMEGAFTLRPNAKMAEIYTTPSKTKAPYESDGDEDAISIKQKFEAEHPGSQLEINEFIADWLGEPCIIVHGSCQDPFKKVVGTACAPVQLKPAGQDDNDGRKHMLVFEQFAKTEWLPGHYTGPLPSVDPFTVVSSTAVALSPANGYAYQLPSLAVTASIAINTNTLEHGDVFTLIGGGGVAPATLASGVTDKSALLVSGSVWTGLAGAVIHLKVFKAGAVTLFTEISRG
jgi:hypothetical protein